MTRKVVLGMGIASLAVCLMAPVLYFAGWIALAGYRAILLGASVAWFACSAWLAATSPRPTP